MATELVKDISFDNDLFFKDGDFAIKESDQNHVIDLINSYVGHFKEFPLVGVGIDRYISSQGQETKIISDVRNQMKVDGFSKIRSIEVDKDFNFFIDAER
jgi:hypothetical protein